MQFSTHTLNTSMGLLQFLKTKKLLRFLVSMIRRSSCFFLFLSECYFEVLIVVYSMSEHPEVVSVFLNQGKKLHTTRSWEFMGLESHGEIRANSLWKKARFGEDTIIANLDTG